MISHFLINQSKMESPINKTKTGGECDICKKYFKYKYNISLHKRVVHEVREEVKCEECEHTFKHMIYLKAHKKRNHEGKNVKCKCDVCGIGISMRNLERHRRNSHGSTNVKCELCEKQFCNNGYELKNHKDTVHDEKQVNILQIVQSNI